MEVALAEWKRAARAVIDAPDVAVVDLLLVMRDTESLVPKERLDALTAAFLERLVPLQSSLFDPSECQVCGRDACDGTCRPEAG